MCQKPKRFRNFYVKNESEFESGAEFESLCLFQRLCLFRYNKQFIAGMFGKHEALGEYDFSWLNKSSYFPHYHAINV